MIKITLIPFQSDNNLSFVERSVTYAYFSVTRCHIYAYFIEDEDGRVWVNFTPSYLVSVII